MRRLLKELLAIITRSGAKLKPVLLVLIITGTIMDSLSAGLIVPIVIVLSRGLNPYTKPLFDAFKALFGIDTYQTFLLISLCFIALFYLLKTVFISIVNSSQNKFIYEVEIKLSTKLFAMYLEQPYVFHLHNNSAQLTKNIYHEVRNICLSISQTFTVFSEGLILLALSGILLYVNPLITLGALAFIIIVVGVLIRVLRLKLKIWANDKQHSDSARLKVLSNALNNVKDIKLYGRYQEFYKAYKIKSEKSAFALMKYANFQKLPNLWLEFVAVTGLIILIGALMLQGNTLVNVIPLLSLYAAVMFRVLPSLNRISAGYQTIKLYRPVIKSLFNALENTQLSHTETKIDINQNVYFERDIKLNNVTYHHEGVSTPLFTNLNLTIPKGSFTGIIGQSGAGKSTLIDIIIGLLNPNLGSVDVDGQNTKYNLRGWQDQIGYVAQSVVLLDDRISSNIAFGIPDDKVDKDLLLQALKDAQLEKFVNSLPEGLNTFVGDRGVRLSGGQRQRIGIARALYHKPSLLVFDEATNSLDPKTEADIMRSINLLKKKKTILFVTHNKSLLKSCDEIYEVSSQDQVSILKNVAFNIDE